MYAALWRSLPGPAWARLIQCLVLVALVVAVLFQWVFPAVSDRLPFTDNTVGAASGIGDGTASGPTGDAASGMGSGIQLRIAPVAAAGADRAPWWA